jgi:hypothetical protein
VINVAPRPDLGRVGQNGLDIAANDEGLVAPDPQSVGGAIQSETALRAASSIPQSGAKTPSVDELVVYAPRRPAQVPMADDGWEHNPAIRALGGGLGFVGGLPAGVFRSLKHAVNDTGETLAFGAKLANFFDPMGQAEAVDQIRDTTHRALQYGRSVQAQPTLLLTDGLAAGKAAFHDLVPFSAPMADTAWGEMKHEFGVGMNVGETAADVAGMFGGGEVLEGLNAARTFGATREANIAKFIDQGSDAETALALSKPYTRPGHHSIIPQRYDPIPEKIGSIPMPQQIVGKRIPEWLMESPWNRSKPPGMSKGDFYEHHYGVDQHFKGTGLPKGLNGGRGWSGAQRGLTKYSLPQRLWAGTPSPWKAAGGIVDTLQVPGLFENNGQVGPR